MPGIDDDEPLLTFGECPYCGAKAAHAEEERHGTGILDETLWVCTACGQSFCRARWTGDSTRRALLVGVRRFGPYVLIAAAAWLLKPYLPYLPRRTYGRRDGSGAT